jgi:putative inorganic carbon (HCO3(-)) transporter
MLFPQPERAWTLLLYPLVLGLQWWAWGAVLPVTPLNPAILLLAIMTGVSNFITPDPASSLVKIAGILLGMLVFFTGVRHSRTRHGWKGTLGLFATASMGVAMVGLLGTSWLPSRLPGINALLSRLPVHLTGLPGAEAGINVNELAGALLWVVPVLAMASLALLADPKWFASLSGRGKLHRSRLVAWAFLLVVPMVICTGILVLTQSRDGYLAMAIACPVLLLFVARGKSRYLVASLLMVGVVAGAVLINHVGIEPTLNQLFGSLPAKGTAFSVSTMYGRAEIWKTAVHAIREKPLTGLGMNVFRKAIYQLDPTFKNPGFDIAHAHDEFFQAALDLGLPGLVGFIALYIGAAGMLVPAIRGKGAWRLLALGLLVGLLAHFLFGITDAVALGAKPGFLFWWLLAMACGLYEQNRAGGTLAA